MKPKQSGQTTNSSASRLTGCAVIIILTVLTSSPLPGATRTWDGSYSGYWSAAQNWAENSVPADGDDVVFPPGAANLVNTNNMSTRTFRSFTISGSGYTLRAGTMGLTGGLSATYASGFSTVEVDVNLASSQTFECQYSSADLYISGDIALGSHTLTIVGAGRQHLGGSLSGTGGLVKNGSGTARFYGGSANTYTGQTRVNSGTLALAKTAGQALYPGGELILGDGLGPALSTVVREEDDFQIGDNVPITINSDGCLDLQNFLDTVGALSFDGGTATSTSGSLILGGNVTVSANGGNISGALGLGNASRIFNIVSPGNLMVDATISGNYGITKTSSGFLTLLSSNSYSGNTTIQGGFVEAHGNHALGNASGGTILQEGTLRLVLAVVTGESLVASGGKFQALGLSNVWLGPITLSAPVFIEMPNAGELLNLEGVIEGDGGFTKTGDGILRLSGSSQNTYRGETFAKAGVLELGKAGLVEAISAGALTIGDGVGGANADVVRELYPHQVGELPIRINDSGLFDLAGNQDWIRDLTIDGGRIVTGSGLLALTRDVSVLANTNRSARIEGRVWLPDLRSFEVADSVFYPDLGIYASVEGGGGMLKSGPGALLLFSSNSYSGLTLVNEGVLGVYHSYGLGDTGGGTVVSNGATIIVNNHSRVPAEPLTISGSGLGGYGALDSFIGTNSWAGHVTLEGATEIRVLDADDSLELSGQVSGAGGLTKTGDGTLIFSGPAPNVYGGDTFVNAGTLAMAKTVANAVPTRLYVGTSSGTEHRAIARNLHSTQCDVVIVNATGLYDLNGFSETLGGLSLLGGGDVETGTGLLTLGATCTLVVDPSTTINATASISGKLNVGTGQKVFEVGQGIASSGNPSDLVINAVISGSAEIVKQGPGELQLTAANAFTGPFTLNDGALRLQHPQGLGSTASGTSVNGDSYLQLHGSDIAVSLEPLTLNSTYRAWGTLYSPSGTNSWAGDITLQSDAFIGVASSVLPDALLELPGTISGPGSLTKVGVGTLLFSGPSSNSYGGITCVNSGALSLNKTAGNGAIPGDMFIGDESGGPEADVVRVQRGNQIANTAAVTVRSSGLLRMVSGAADAIGSLSGSGIVDLGSDDLHTGYNNTSTTYAGVIRGGIGSELNKAGTGVFTLTGNNTYTGWTYIHDGVLAVQGNQPASPVSVGADGTLAGTGTIGDLVSIGNVQPGTSPGMLSCRNADLSGGTFFYVDLNGITPGTEYDQLNTQAAKLSNPFLHVSLGYMPAVGDSFVILDNDGPDATSGTFAFLPEGASLNASNATLRISYGGSTGNDVVLTVTSVTEVNPLEFTSVQCSAGEVLLNWEGGVPFYVLEKTSSLDGLVRWQAVTGPMRATQTNLPMEGTAAFFRVLGRQ